MSKVRLKLKFELETEDMSDETIRKIELSAAGFVEILEAQLAQHIAKNCPGIKISSGSDDDEDEESWRG